MQNEKIQLDMMSKPIEKLLRHETRRLVILIGNVVEGQDVDMQELSLIWGTDKQWPYNKTALLVTAMKLANMVKEHHSHKKKIYEINRQLILDFLDSPKE
ncbi:hypothetical protein M1590_01195 [Candidatus Marsarchaeota archaeon]|nr:hypothetical protein [Candidatus Marsarchaeota archaeon]